MQYRKLGRTGLFVSELCLGTMTYGGKGFWAQMGDLGLDAVTEQLRTAIDAGVNFVDTANVYHEGESEKLVAGAIARLGLRRDSLVLATKARGRMGPGPNDAGLSRKHLFASIDASLQRLGTDYIDLYQIHGVDKSTPLEETVEALADIVRSGKVRYVGFCNLPAWIAMKALAIADRRGLPRFVSAQMFYAIAARDIENEIAPLAQEEGLAVLPWSPLAGGLLSGKFQPDADGPQGARRTTFDFPIVDKTRAFACVDAMRPMAEARGVSVAQIALAYLLHKPFVTSVIIGARTQAQLVDNLAAPAVKLTSDELQILNDVSMLPASYPGWMVEWQNGRDRNGDGSLRV
jgi:aryl-alcohol dehydrogenase-like predicted oxidoreductase